MRLVPTFAWRLEKDGAEPDDTPLDTRLVPLLEAIARTASLAAAVAERGISYRAAWGLLRDCERVFGFALVKLERGRGATLTATGAALLRAQSAATQRFARIAPGLAVDIGAPASQRKPAAPLRLRVAASHDLALAALAQMLPRTAGIEVDLAVMGSLVALREFAEGRAQFAGFHVPLVHPDFDRAPFLRWLSARRDRLVRFVDREQGLILPRGNPEHVKHLGDVAAKRLRFVNRQRDSGTRLLIDRLIDAERIEASALKGYGTEEFTHAAVAATVASGGADVGFGLRAAAAEYGLAFVPLVRERYFFAVRTRDLRKPAIVRLLAAVREPAFARLLRRLPGYHGTAAGAVTGVEAIAATPVGRASTS